MSWRIPIPVSAASADWDVEAELQKELDAVSVCSHISSSSSSTGAEETFPDDADRTNSPLHKLLDNWRIKERKLQSFEKMLSGTQPWNYDMLHEISDRGQELWPGPSDYAPETIEQVQGLVDPTCRRGQPASCDKHSSQIDSVTLEETSTSASSFSQQFSSDLSSSNFHSNYPGFAIGEQAGQTIDRFGQSQERGTMPTILISDASSQDFDSADVRCTRTYQGENDFPYCPMDYEEAISKLRKKRMGMLEEYRAVEAEKLAGRDLKRERETEESRIILLLDSQRRRELENEIWKEKQNKISQLDLELAKQIELFEELQRTEERDLETQKLDMGCRSRSVAELVDTHEHHEEELELRRLEHDETLDLTAHQVNRHEQALQTAPDDHCVKCCVRIQSWIRGFICRRNYHDMKHRNARSLVSLLLPEESADMLSICGQEYPMCEQHEDTGTVTLSEEATTFIHGQEYQQCGAQEEYGPITTSQNSIHGEIQSPEEILTMLTGLAESGSMQDFKSCLDLATSYGLIDEASEVEHQLIQRKENVQSWLEQVVQGWDTTRSKIEAEIQEARRLEIFPILTVAEAIISAREKEIHDNLEASIVKASRRNYSYWMRKANNFGLKDTMETFSKSFQRTIKMVRNSLKRETKLGTKEKYVVLFKDAILLGLELEVNLALKIVLKRVLQVFKRAIFLECNSIADVDSREQDWNRVEMEGAEIGLDSQTFADLRQTLGTGRSFESVQRIWINTFKTTDTGGQLTVNEDPIEVADPINDSSVCQMSGDFREFSMTPGISLSAVSPAAVLKSKAFWSLPQNWPEINRLQRDWQEHTLHLRILRNDNSNYSQNRGYSMSERDSVSTRCARDRIPQCTTNAAIANDSKENVDLEDTPIGCLNSDKDCGEEEGPAAFEEDLRAVCQAQINEMPEHQKVSPRKSTLTRQMLEEKLSCNRAELRWVMKLDLTDEHIKSVGRANMFRWCPRLRFLTIDMNRLTTLRGVLQGGEDSLEQLSVKDNLLRDIAGLECLHKLTVLHLDGNLLPQLGFPLSSPILANENGKKERNGNKSVTGNNRCIPLGGRPGVEYSWPSLKVLTVGCNRLTKFFKIGNVCPNLEVFEVGSNQLFSLGCAEDNALAGLHHLRVLDVGQNQLQGRSLWKGLENCPELVSLVASRNKLRELPNHFGSVLLREIWLNGNAIKRLSCKAWLPSLQRLYLQDNMIDTLESLWGCPALEVLDLSFNSISELSHLQHLSCFPCLRSLQLNDNPVSEQEDHATCVLEAVPWLAELDNEAVTKTSRDRAVTKIFKRIIDVVGIEFLKEILSRGELLLHGVANPSVAHKSSLNNMEPSESNTDQFLPELELNNVLNGEADDGVLWKILSEAKRLASSSSIMQNLLAKHKDMVKFEGLRSFSESEFEARSKVIAYQQMTFGLKGRLHAATKETCAARLLKERNQTVPAHPNSGHPIQNPCHAVPLLNISSKSNLIPGRAGESNLEWCLEEHIMFDSKACREVYSENKEYKLQAQTQIRRVVRLQALVRGHLTRIQVKLLMQQKTAMCHEQEHRCARKIQAVWRGWKARQAKLLEFYQRAQFCGAVFIQAHWRGYSIRLRFRRALDMAKYTDEDDFEYVPIDDSEFLAGEIALSAVYQSSESIVAGLSNPSTSPSRTMTTSKYENPQAFIVADGEGIKPSEWDNHGRLKTKTMITPVVTVCKGTKPAERDAHGHHETNQLTFPFESDTRDAKDIAPLDQEVENDANHAMEVSQGTVPTDILFQQETGRLTAPEDEICTTQPALEGRHTGIENLKEPETKEETKESEEKVIADLLERVGINSKRNMHVTNVVSEGLEISEEVSRIVKGHLEEITHSSGDPKDQIKPDERDPSSIPAAEVKKRATVEELAKDWGFKDERTAQALFKARQRTQQQAKDAAHRNALQDPEKRLKRFREKVQGLAPAVGAPTRQFEKKRASFNFAGLTLQMPVDEQESYIHPEPEVLYRSEIRARKVDGSNGPISVPRLPHSKNKKSFYPESVETKKGMRKHPTKSSTRYLSAILLPTVVLNTALQFSTFNNL